MRLWRLLPMVPRCSVVFSCLFQFLLPALMGLFLGMTLSMMYYPFSEDSCETFYARQDPQTLIKHRETRSIDSNLNDLYEPRVIEAGNIDQSAYKLDTKAGAKFYRPKFAATELGVRQKLFVAVLSSMNSLNNLGVAVNKTLSPYATKTVFFIDQKAAVVPPEIMIVNFEDGYNHLMPINVLKYVIKKFGHDYDYFMFLSDKGYVRAEKIFDLVSLISVSRHVHMGAPKALEGGKTYCSIEGGVIVSQSILAQVNSSLKWCSDNCHHTDQSVNLGKCLLHASDLGCQNSVGSKNYPAYPVKDFNFDIDIDSLKEQLEFNKSLSVFPVPDDITHYKLHRYFCEVELNSTRHQIQQMKDNILNMSQYAPGGRDSITWPVAVPEPYKPKNRFDVIRWDYFTETHIFFQDDFTNVKELMGVDKLDIQDVIRISMEKLNQKYNNKYLYSYLINGYRRFDPQRGMEYMMDLALDDTSVPQGVNTNRVIVEKRVSLVRPLGEVEIVPMPYVTESTRVNIVVPVTVRDMDGLHSFLEAYSRLQVDAGDSLALILVFVYQHLPKSEDEDIFAVLKTIPKHFDDKNKAGVKTVIMNFASNETYIPEYKIIDLVSSQTDNDALMYMGTVGMLISTEMLNRIRIHTIVGWQVFFPIGFWQFKPNLIFDKKPYPTDVEFNSRLGHYDILSFEHGSFFISDYKEARQSINEAEVINYDVYQIFVRHGKLHVFRAVEPEFKHYYMQMECLSSSPAALFERCAERRSQSLGTRSQLAKHIFEYQAKKKAELVSGKDNTNSSKDTAQQKSSKDIGYQKPANKDAVNIVHQELANENAVNGDHQKPTNEETVNKGDQKPAD